MLNWIRWRAVVVQGSFHNLGITINQLTTLDVSKNTALEQLDCSSNQLTTLDVSGSTALTDLNCSGGPEYVSAPLDG